MGMTAEYNRGMRTWPLLLALGLVNAVIGIALMAWPGVTLTVVVFLYGIQLLIYGVLRIVIGIASPLYHHWLVVLVGLFGVVVGLLIMREPLRTLELVVLLIGIFLVVAGIVGFIAAFTGPPHGEAHAILDALLPLAFGAFLLVWPNATVRVLALIAGAFLIIWSSVVLFAAYLAYQTETAQLPAANASS